MPMIPAAPPAAALARDAIDYVLSRVRTDPDFAEVMIGTEALAKCIAAFAALHGDKTEEEVRERVETPGWRPGTRTRMERRRDRAVHELAVDWLANLPASQMMDDYAVRVLALIFDEPIEEIAAAIVRERDAVKGS